MMNQRTSSILPEPHFDQSEALLDRARKALRLADYDLAAQLLGTQIPTKELKLSNRAAAERCNLMGALFEGKRQWHQAEKHYAKAIELNHRNAKLNLQRLIELRCKGFASRAVLLGDEDQGIWYADLSIH